MGVQNTSLQRVCRFDPRTLTTGVDILIDSEIAAINPAVEKLLRLLRNSCGGREHEFAVEMALREALANAIVHGNHCDKTKKVLVCFGCDSAKGILIVVKDEGEGFNPADVPSPLLDEGSVPEHGRGILLMRTFMDEIHFEDGGREIHMRKGGRTSH